MDIGEKIYTLGNRLFPICRSITGDGVRETLWILREIVPDLTVCEVPTGTKVFDWEVPKEWNIRDAWIKNSKGEKVLDFKETNLSVVGYSVSVDKKMSLEELLPLIYTQPDQPDAIPYVTSYYKERFGFCMTEKQKTTLPEDIYHVFIDSVLEKGNLTYGELFIPSTEGNADEIFFSTYICHPSMANNEISGPAVAIYLAKWLLEQKQRRYGVRMIFVPETIGAITYLSRHVDEMKKCVRAGFNISCVGDNRTYYYVASRYGKTLADRVAKNVLSFHYPAYKEYSFLERGSDERQYNAPGVDLPVCAICRSKYGEYPEYHTSKDNMAFISPEGLRGAYEVLQKIICALEHNFKYRIKCLAEPQLGKRGLYPTVSQKGKYDEIAKLTDFIAYADGTNDMISISNIIGVPVDELILLAEKLAENDLLEKVGE